MYVQIQICQFEICKEKLSLNNQILFTFSLKQLLNIYLLCENLIKIDKKLIKIKNK